MLLCVETLLGRGGRPFGAPTCSGFGVVVVVVVVLVWTSLDHLPPDLPPLDPPPPDRPKFRSFFSLSPPPFHSFFSLWVVFSLNFGGV